MTNPSPSLALVTPPAGLALTLADAKAHCRVEHALDDAYITALVKAATLTAEAKTGRRFITQVWEARYDRAPSCPALDIPYAPLQSIGAITYRDAAGALQTWDAANYQVDTAGLRGRVAPVYGGTWPAARADLGSFVVRFTCGYGADASAVPEPLRQAIAILVATYYEFRVAFVSGVPVNEVPRAVDALIDPFRTFWV